MSEPQRTLEQAPSLSLDEVSANSSVESLVETDADSAANLPAESESKHPPSARIKLGSARDGVQSKPLAKPVTPGVSKPTRQTQAKSPSYPPPSITKQLSPEQELELAAALGDESLDDLIDSAAGAPPVEIAPDTRMTGIVASINDEFLLIDLGAHRQGALPLKQFDVSSAAADGDPTTLDIPEVGNEIALAVVRLNTEEGLYELSLPTAAVEISDWGEVNEGQIVEVTVTGVNKGGLDCTVSGIRGFMPMGQISIYRVEKPEDYVGQRLPAVITEANAARGNLVLSHRGVMERERAEKREQMLAELAPGQVHEGTVRSLKEFGAFVDLGGIDGLIHISKMSWDRVNHPSEVLTEGQAVKVKIEQIDPDTGKIALSYRESTANPWDDVPNKYAAGSTVRGKVSKLMQFGAFVKLEPGVEGLIHISELGHGRVNRVSDIVAEEQQVEVKVLSIDLQQQRIGLSLKALSAPPQQAKGEGNTAGDDEPEFVPPADAPKTPKKRQGELKGGISGPSGGEHFGLKW